MIVHVNKMVDVSVMIRGTIAIAMAITMRQHMTNPMAEAMGESLEAVAV